MVVDGTVTLMGSYNWTRGASENSEDLNLVSSLAVAAAYTTHWRQRLAVPVRFAEAALGALSDEQERLGRRNGTHG